MQSHSACTVVMCHMPHNIEDDFYLSFSVLIFYVLFFVFFFFKQKTAYEMSASLVGSEMCIRDRLLGYPIPNSRCSHP